MASKVFIDNILDPATGDQGFFLGMNADNGYPGMDLSLKFAEEIKGYTSVWKWIQARIKAGNFYGIHVGDYIPFNCTNSAKTHIVAVVAGIDTYYKYGDQQVGHHIDFISKDLWPTYIQYNLANFNNGLIPVEKLSGDGSKTEFVLTKQMDSIDNINLDNLKRNVIDRHILDQRLNALAKNFVDAPNLEHIKYGQPTKENGLYIGPEDSQIFAIAYPNSIDHTVKDQWRQRWFARYMDDSYIINKSKELLIEFRRLLFGLFAEKGIIPNPKKTQIVKLRRGFTYLKTKFTLLPNGKVLQQPCRESVIRERRKIKKFFNFLQAGLMTMEQILTSYMSWRGSLIKKQARRSVHCTDLLFYKLYGIMPWKIKSKRKSKARHIQWKNFLNASTPSMLKSPPLKAC